jgi:hypothetical protein
MPLPADPDPRLLRLVSERDELRKKLTSEKRKASILRTLLHQEKAKARTADAATKRPEQHAR